MSIINFLTYYNRRIVFYKSVNASDKIQDANYIESLMDSVKDIGELDTVKKCVVQAQSITKFVYNHHWVHSLMQKYVNDQILQPGITRFVTNFIALKSLQ
ncbi:hypothetical protein B296_00028788 [Ensete ventricosum]|uniref:Uncharacterized protein n=1 Tax=Ensete ventricosum TaxID=4639 RepID=A0A426XPY1_ENSVE|nr:hypothetical protein B296_00028788 [Ensete ventricosum]